MSTLQQTVVFCLLCVLAASITEGNLTTVKRRRGRPKRVTEATCRSRLRQTTGHVRDTTTSTKPSTSVKTTPYIPNSYDTWFDESGWWNSPNKTRYPEPSQLYPIYLPTETDDPNITTTTTTEGSTSTTAIPTTPTTVQTTTPDEYETWFDQSGFWNEPNKTHTPEITRARLKFPTRRTYSPTPRFTPLRYFKRDNVTGGMEAVYYSLQRYYRKPENQKKADHKVRDLIRKHDERMGIAPQYTWVSYERKADGRLRNDDLREMIKAYGMSSFSGI